MTLAKADAPAATRQRPATDDSLHFVHLADARSLSDALRQFDNLEECLLLSLGLVHHGYTAELRFEHLRRGRAVPETAFVTVTMEAVSTLRLVGGLSRSMVEHPENINWGLSEVALVNSYPATAGIGLKVAWESDRLIIVEAARASISVSPARD